MARDTAKTRLRGTPVPLPGEEATMPRDDGGGLHDLHGPSPAAPHSREQHPEESVGSTEPEPSWRGLLDDCELVAQRHDFHFEFGPRSEAGPNGGKEGGDGWAHAGARYQQRPVSSITTRSADFLVGTAVRAFVQHYHEERPHQGLGNELIAPKTKVLGTGPVRCHERLGGVLKFYDREAA